MADTPSTGAGSFFLGDIEPVTETDDELRQILLAAELPPLLPALAYVTGDLSLLREDLRPDPLLFSLPGGGLTEEQADEIRRVALVALTAFRDGGSVPAARPVRRRRAADHGVHGRRAEMRPYLPLLEEELAYRGEDRRGPTWTKAELAPAVPLPRGDHRRRHVGPRSPPTGSARPASTS